MASIIEKTYEDRFLEPEQPPVEPAIEALEFIKELNPESPEQIRGFFKEYELYRVLTAVIETFGEIDTSQPADIRPGFGGKNPDKVFHAGICHDWTPQDPTTLPECIYARVLTYGQDKATGDPTTNFRGLYIHDNGRLQGSETLFNKYHRPIKHEDPDELGSFGILQHLCGAMIEHLSILKEEREEALAGQVALAA